MDDTEPITIEGDAVVTKRRTGRASLTVVGGPGLGRVHKVRGPETVIGRGAEANITIDGEGVSRLHSKVVVDGDGRATLVDLGSTNGTYLNGLRVVAEPLRDNDKVQLGRTVAMVFRYEYRDAGYDEAAGADVSNESMDGVYETISATLDNLARMYERKKDWTRAIETHRRIQSMQIEKLGAGHPRVVEIAQRVIELEEKLGTRSG